MDESAKRKPGSLLKRALFNQYNYILLAGSAVLAAATGSALPAIVGAGAEVLWLVLGADSKLFRRWVERQESKEAQARVRAETAAMLAALEDGYRERFLALSSLSEEIRGLAKEKTGFETALLQQEMGKLDQLLFSFLKMASAHQRLGNYLGENPVSDVEREIARVERSRRHESDGRVQASLDEQLALAQKRLGKRQQIEGAWKALSVRMETLEKSFDLLKSHILGIGTHEELAAALDDLVNGVASADEIDAATADFGDELRAVAASRMAAGAGQRR